MVPGLKSEKSGFEPGTFLFLLMKRDQKKALFLGGNSTNNYEWIHSVEIEMKSLFTETFVLNYYHWENGEDSIDFKRELKHLETLMFDPYFVFCKSAGSILALLAIKGGIIKPKKILICGFAYSYAKSRNIDPEKLLLDTKANDIHFIQKEFDPAINVSDLKKVLIKLNLDFEIIQIPGDNHSYENIELLKKIAEEMLQK